MPKIMKLYKKHLICNQQVPGSIPGASTNYYQPLTTFCHHDAARREDNERDNRHADPLADLLSALGIASPGDVLYGVCAYFVLCAVAVAVAPLVVLAGALFGVGVGWTLAALL